MTIRSLGLAVFLVSIAAACQQKMAPTEEPTDGDSTAKSGDTTLPAADDQAKDKPADKPASSTTPTDAAAPPPAKTDASAKTDDANKDAPANPEEVGTCLAECKDPDCASKCFDGFGGGGDPFGF